MITRKKRGKVSFQHTKNTEPNGPLKNGTKINKTEKPLSIKGSIRTHKPSIFTHSKPRTTPHTRVLKCLVLITLCCKTKHLRSLVQGIVQGFEWLEMLDYCNAINQRTIICHKCCWIFLCFILVYFCSVRSEFLKRDIWNWNIKGYLPRGIERGWGGKSPCSLHLYSMGPRNSVPSLKKLKLAEFMDN